MQSVPRAQKLVAKAFYIVKRIDSSQHEVSKRISGTQKKQERYSLAFDIHT
jgi:hypothetical protein